MLTLAGANIPRVAIGADWHGAAELSQRRIQNLRIGRPPSSGQRRGVKKS